MNASIPSSSGRRREAGSRALWLIAAAPAVWLVVFVVVYVVVAIDCARTPTGATPIGPARTAALFLAAGGTAAILGIGALGWRRIPRQGREDGDATRGREHFVGWVTTLLSGLSALAMAYVVLTLALLGTCQ